MQPTNLHAPAADAGNETQTPELSRPNSTDMTTPNNYPHVPHLAGMSFEEIMAYDNICQHEVAHGVMRWLLGHKATEIWATPTDGYCAGTGKQIDTDHALLITLAGFAHEMGYLPCQIDWDSTHDHDFDVARGLLDAWHMRISIRDGLPVTMNMNEALEMWLGRAADMLFRHIDFIERAGEVLMVKRKLSARSFAAMLRHYDRDLRSRGRGRDWCPHSNLHPCGPDNMQGGEDGNNTPAC